MVVPLRKNDTVRFVTPIRTERVLDVGARLARSTRLALDTSYPADVLVVWGDRQKLQDIKTYRDVQNIRSAFQDDAGRLLVLTNDLLVGFKSELTIEACEALLRPYRVTVLERRAAVWKCRVIDPDEDAPLQVAQELQALDGVAFAEPNAMQALTLLRLPPEPLLDQQWHLHNTGRAGGVAGADVDAPTAWEITTGRSDIAIVIHDSGVDIHHPDLSANLNAGWDFDHDDSDATNAANSHGTACAGIAAAALNGVGVAGLAPGCRITPLKAALAHTWDDWARTIDWAATHGRIISCSWSITPNNTLAGAFRRASQNGVVVFCAAGNDGSRSGRIAFPASLPETIGVGASTNRDTRANYSQIGEGLDLLAPSSGGTLGIETTDNQGVAGYNAQPGPAGNYTAVFGGTSAATPLAAGAAALMLSVNPQLTPESIRQLLRGAATKIEPAVAGYDANGRSDSHGYGRLNAARAVQRARGAQRVIADFGYTAGGWRVEKHPRFVAHLTQDRRADILGFGEGGVLVALNNGNGTFQAPRLQIADLGYGAGGWRIDRHPRFLADLTGDGCADIVGFGEAGVWVALNRGDGSFQTPQLALSDFGYSVGGWRVERHPRYLADVSGDGRADIVGFGEAGVLVALNNGNGTFQPPHLVVRDFACGAGGWQVDRHPRFLADVNGDGRADIVGFGEAGVWVALSNGRGTFAQPRLVLEDFGYLAGGWRVNQHPRFVVDVNGDGRADIVGFGEAGVWVALGNANGTFQAPHCVLPNFGRAAGGWRVDRHPRLVVDVNGDGRADIVGFGEAGVWVALNQGNGTFQAPQLVLGDFGYSAGGWQVEKHPRFVADVAGTGNADAVGFGDAGVLWGSLL